LFLVTYICLLFMFATFKMRFKKHQLVHQLVQIKHIKVMRSA